MGRERAGRGGYMYAHPHHLVHLLLLVVHLPLNLQLHASASAFPRDSHASSVEITIPVHVLVQVMGTRCAHECVLSLVS
jgi:uncharacterized membrane protein YozB (DUF420 family)